MVFIMGQEYRDLHEAMSRHIVSISTIYDFKVVRHVDSNNGFTVHAVGGGDSYPLFESKNLKTCLKTISNILEKHANLSDLTVVDVDECFVSQVDHVNDALTAMCEKLEELGQDSLVEQFYNAVAQQTGETPSLGSSIDDEETN